MSRVLQAIPLPLDAPARPAPLVRSHGGRLVIAAAAVAVAGVTALGVSDLAHHDRRVVIRDVIASVTGGAASDGSTGATTGPGWSTTTSGGISAYQDGAGVPFGLNMVP